MLTVMPAQALAQSETSRFWIEGEAGPVWQTRNEVQVPADTGTRFKLTSFGTGPEFTGRVYLGYRFDQRHEIRGLYAPLRFDLGGVLDSAVSFRGTNFASGAPTNAKYVFNSYRLTYRYVFTNSALWKLRAGFTGKIRDAEIQLTQGSTTAKTTNVGFVPLLHFSATYNWSRDFRLHVDVDALAAPQGRAEDIALLLGYRPSSHSEVRLGYRTVEGGSEGGGGTYAFAWLHYLVAGLQFDF